MKAEAILLMGFPASGKSTVAKQYIDQGYSYLNRDSLGGKVQSLAPMMMNELSAGHNVLLDNTFPTVESRKQFIDGAKQTDCPVKCLVMGTSIEDAQFNAALRMYQRKGRLLEPDDYKKEKDPNLFPPAALFGYAKKFEEPTVAEGFDSVEKIPFVRKMGAEYCNKALILDYDGTLRKTKSGVNYPVTPDDVEILPGRSEKLLQYQKDGYKLLGVSNQSGIAKELVTDEMVRKCFDHTNDLLGVQIDYLFCPHGKFPIACYCRKPMPGHGVVLIEKYKLDRSQCIFVGDMTSDKTFAKRSGFKYVDQAVFFK